MGKTTIDTTQITTMGFYPGSNGLNITLLVPVGVSVVVLFGLLATVVALLFLVYYKRRSALVNLTKPHKGSEENSYASSEHSHQQGSKYSESPKRGYDVIKPMHTKNVKAKSFPPKLKSLTHLDVNPTHPSEYVSIEDTNCDLLHYSEINSSHKTTGSYIYSCGYSAPSAKDNPSINVQKCGKMKQEVFIADSEIEDKDKQKQLTEDAAKCNSTKYEISPISPQTIELMYTAVQKKPRVNAGMDSEFEDSTPPPHPRQLR